MYVHILLYFLFSLLVPSEQAQHWVYERFSEQENANNFITRLINLMRSIYYDADDRIMEVNPIRFQFEDTANYEQGYLFAEIIERYKKMVEALNRMTRYKSYDLYDVQDKLDHIQTLYFEIYHLVNMMHEIPNKYKKSIEFDPHQLMGGASMAEAAGFNAEEYEKAKAAFEKEQELKRQLLRHKKRMLKERQKLLAEGKLNLEETEPDHIFGKNIIPSPGAKRDWPYYNKTFSSDYGWEISYW